jgi:putative ABC transport system permease protein
MRWMPLSSAIPPSLRILLKNWKLVSIAIVSLAIALALGIVAFGMFDAALLRPPAAVDPGRLVNIYTSPKPGAFEHTSYADYVYLRDHNDVFSGLAAFPYGVSKGFISIGDRDEMALTNAVSDNYFEVMGIKPAIGRLFSRGDDDRKAHIAVLTYSYWQRHGADPQVVGRTVTADGTPSTIVGVAQKGFTGPVFGFAADIITPLAAGASSDYLTNHEARRVDPVGRLKPGVTRAQARAEVAGLWRQLRAAYPIADKDLKIEVLPTTVMHPEQIPPAKLISAVVLLIMFMILMIGCANAANLLLAIATGRKQETLIKAALGAWRGRIVRDFLKESVILCAISGALGYLLAYAALESISQFSLNLPVFGAVGIAHNLRPDSTVAGFALGLIALAALATGLAPALHTSTPMLARALSGELVIGGTRRGVIRNTIVVMQVAICTLVLIGVGVSWLSLANLRSVDPGFSSRNLVAVMIYLHANSIQKPQGLKLYEDLRQGALATRGVEAACLTDGADIGIDEGRDEVHIPGRPEPAHPIMIRYSVVDDQCFPMYGIQLLAGRAFDSSDREATSEVIVINRKMAETYWPGEDPIGKGVRLKNGNRTVSVVGVVADGKYGDLDQPTLPFMYFALSQHYQEAAITLIARTRGDPRRWIEPIAQVPRRLGLKVFFEPETLDEWMNLQLFLPIVMLRCVAALSAIALLLAVVGLYGTIFYSVSERRREIGIRVALGAVPRQLFSMVLKRTALIAGVGVVAGTALGIAATVLLRSQFFGIRVVEWYVLAPVAVSMILLAAVVAMAAARPWMRMNPMEAVRHV